MMLLLKTLLQRCNRSQTDRRRDTEATWCGTFFGAMQGMSRTSIRENSFQQSEKREAYEKNR